MSYDKKDCDPQELIALLKRFKETRVDSRIKKNIVAQLKKAKLLRTCRTCEDVASYGFNGTHVFSTGHNPVLCQDCAYTLERELNASDAYPARKAPCGACGEVEHVERLMGVNGGLRRLPTGRVNEFLGDKFSHTRFLNPLRGDTAICTHCANEFENFMYYSGALISGKYRIERYERELEEATTESAKADAREQLEWEYSFQTQRKKSIQSHIKRFRKVRIMQAVRCKVENPKASVDAYIKRIVG